MTLSPADLAKYAAAAGALDLVAPGMKLGLGTGSTAEWLVRLLARAPVARGLLCVPTSRRTADLGRALGLRIEDLDRAGPLDLVIDGADEFDPAFDLIKGGGGAHLHEKIVAASAARMAVIADASKRVARLGAFPLPVEVIPFGAAGTLGRIARALEGVGLAGCPVALRGGAVRTDEGNLVADIRCGAIPDARALAAALEAVTGVVEHGLFLGLCDTVVIGAPDGGFAREGLSGARAEGRADPARAVALLAGG
jgi:ribose 5-phosphate isomerase A